MSGMGKPSGDQQTWVYRTGQDQWESGSTGVGGSGTTVISSSGWVTAFDIDFTTLPTASYTSNGAVDIGGYTWQLENMSNADNIGIWPGVGLIIDPNANNSDFYITTYTAPSIILPITRSIPNFNLHDYELRLWINAEVSGANQNNELLRAGFAKYPLVNGGTRYFVNWVKGFSGALLALFETFFNNGTATSTGESGNRNVAMIDMRSLYDFDYYNGIVAPTASFEQASGSMVKYGSTRGLGGTNTVINAANTHQITGSGDLSIHLMGFPNNTSNHFNATYRRLRLDYRLRSDKTNITISGSSGDTITLVPGPGITTSTGSNSAVTISSSFVAGSPADFSGLKGWYEAHTSSITLDGTGTPTVREWRDLSSNANHLGNSTKAQQPVWNPSNVEFGTPSVDFQAAHILSSSANMALETFTVIIATQTKNNGGIVYEHGTNTFVNGDGSLLYTSTNLTIWARRGGSSTSKDNAFGPWGTLNTLPTVLVHHHGGTVATHRMFVRNIDERMNTVDANNISSTSYNARLFVGARAAAHPVVTPELLFSGSIVGLAVYSPALRTDQIFKVIRYFGQRFNIGT